MKKKPIAKPEDLEGVTLMHMRTQNVKRVRLIDLTLQEPLTLIGSDGENSQGKTSFLDSYAMCLGGKEVIKSITLNPIRNGEQEGSIVCDFGDGKDVKLSVRRTLMRVGESDWTADLDVEIPGHIAPSSIETFLKKLTGAFSFDPMAFDRLTDAERFDQMQKFVADFDFASHALARKQIFDTRTDAGRDLKREQAAADAIEVPEKAPCDESDEAEIQRRLKEASEKNMDTQTRATNRGNARDKITELQGAIGRFTGELRAFTDNVERERDEAIARANAEFVRKVGAETERLSAVEAAERKTIADLEAKLANLPPLAEFEDLDAISAELDAARKSNLVLNSWRIQHNRRKEHLAEVERLQEKWADLTAKLAEMDKEKQKAIEDAKLPVTGIGFGDGLITLNGVPWKDAGHAERYDASTDLAMALNPKLKVILIRDGSNVGKSIRQRIRDRAKACGYRVLMEVVEEGEGTHVVIEDGRLKQQPEQQELASA